LFLNPFRPPAVFTLNDSAKVAILAKKLVDLDYIHDGVFFTKRDFTDCLDDPSSFDWGKKFGKPLAGKQVMHRSGLVFVRTIEDNNGKAVVFAFTNLRYAEQENGDLQLNAQDIFDQLATAIRDLMDS